MEIFEALVSRYHNSRMINYDLGDGVSVEVSGVSNKSMRSASLSSSSPSSSLS